MNEIAKTACGFGFAALVALPGAALAHDPAPQGRVEEPRAASPARPSIDPLIEAWIIGLAAAALREAAESPDPVAALGYSIERKLMFALRSPELAREAERLIAEAVKDAPEELREPLARFATAMLKSLRREMLDSRSPRRVY